MFGVNSNIFQENNINIIFKISLFFSYLILFWNFFIFQIYILRHMKWKDFYYIQNTFVFNDILLFTHIFIHLLLSVDPILIFCFYT